MHRPSKPGVVGSSPAWRNPQKERKSKSCPPYAQNGGGFDLSCERCAMCRAACPPHETAYLKRLVRQLREQLRKAGVR